MPDWSFVLAGPRVEPTPELDRRRNIHFIGPVAYPDLPSLAGGLDALMLPYVVSEFTQTLSPLKLNEYLLTGRPVVSTGLAEAEKRKPLVVIARGADQWRAALVRGLEVDRVARVRVAMDLLRGESWAGKAAWLAERCAQIESDDAARLPRKA